MELRILPKLNKNLEPKITKDQTGFFRTRVKILRLIE